MDRLIGLDMGKGPSRTAWTTMKLPANPFFEDRPSRPRPDYAIWPHAFTAHGKVIHFGHTNEAVCLPASELVSREVAGVG